ncbi:MAG: hypothetical protein WDO18_14025 [Acidobacteriota bacterium]
MIYSPKTQYRVITEIQKKYQAFSDYLSKIYFKTADGNLVPLDSLAKVKETVDRKAFPTRVSCRP